MKVSINSRHSRLSRSITFTPFSRSQSRPPAKVWLSPTTSVPILNCRTRPLQYQQGARRRHHHQVSITRLSARAAKGVSLAMNAGIALLHAAIAAPAEQFAFARKQCRADGNATFAEADARLFNGHRQHLLAFRNWQRHKSNLNQWGSFSGLARRSSATSWRVELQRRESTSYCAETTRPRFSSP